MNNMSKPNTNLKRKREKGKTVDEVFNEIKLMLFYNNIVPGQKLIYQDLGLQLNTSTTPIIHALERLRQLNLVRYIPNRGFFVAEITEAEANEIFAVREALELYVIPEVIKNLTEAKMKALWSAYREYKKTGLLKKRKERMQSDTDLHLKIVKYAENKLIINLLSGIYERLYIKYRPEYLNEKRMKDAENEHEAILKAMEKRDVNTVKKILKRHIRGGKKHIIENLKSYHYSSASTRVE